MLRPSLAALLPAMLGAATPALAQDVMRVAADHYTVLVDNEFVRVVQNTLPPGAKDAMHTHPAGWYYVTQPGKMRVAFASGKTEMWEPKTGESGWSDPEAAHTSENVGDATMSYVLIEVKDAATLGFSRGTPRPAPRVLTHRDRGSH